MKRVFVGSKFSIENLVQRIKPMNIEKIQSYSHVLESSGYQNFEPNLRINNFWTEFSSTNVKILIEILREEIKPVVGEKFEFQDRDKSIFLAFSGIFWQSKFWTTEQK